MISLNQSKNIQEYPVLSNLTPSKKVSRQIVQQNMKKNTFTNESKITKDEFSKQIASKLFRTRLCRNVYKKDDGSWSFCSRDKCDFYHSLDEFIPSPCRFDLNCRHKYGLKDSTCKHKHTDETINQWLTRSKQTLPDIPNTNTLTRKYNKKTVTYSKNISSPIRVPVPVRVPIRQTTNTQYNPISTPTNPSTPTSTPISTPVSTPISTPISAPISTPISTPTNNNTQPRIVKVPNQKLAEIALQTLFEQNIFNVKVIVEQ